MSEKERLAVDQPVQAVNAMGTGTSGVFVRDATGLVKNVSFIDSVALNLSNMSIGALLGVIGLSGLLPMLFAGQDLTGVNLVYLCLIAFVLSTPQIVIYTILTRRYPRAGGDYVFVSRNLGGFVGSVASFVGYTTETTAYLALITLSTVFAIGTVGLFFNITSNFYLGISAPVGPFFPPATPSWQFVIGMLIFAALIGINIVKPKAGYRLVSVLTIVGVLALLTAIGTYLVAGPTGVQNYVNGVSGNGYFTNSSAPASSSYSNLVNGIHTGSPPGSNGFAWGPTIFLLPLIAAFVFPWLNAAPAVAGEIKGKSAVRWNVPISAALAFVFLISSIAVMYWAAGQAFVNAAFSNTSYVFGSPTIFAFNFWTFAMGLSGNSFVAAFIGLGWILANMGILAYGIIVISRYLLAQSFDRFLPSAISDVNPRFGSPVKAFIISLVVTVVLVGYAAYYYTTESLGAGTNPLFGAILAAMIYFMIVGVAAIVHGIKKETGITKMVMPLAGVGNILVFGFIAYQFLTYQSMWAINSFTFGWLGLCLGVGIVAYVGSYYYHKGRGININLAYKEIPPE